jgi:UDP:flavonoid glycosyltransferase YjiC (YdhE family)
MNAGNFYQESLDAVKHLNRRAVLLMGNNPSLKNLPANVLAVNYVPYSQIFPRACAIVHQGGIGTTAQALRAGHLTLVIPYRPKTLGVLFKARMELVQHVILLRRN